MTPGEALAAVRAAEARDGAPNLKQRRALLAALARAVMARSHELMAVLDAEYEGRAPIETLPARLSRAARLRSAPGSTST
ncbi:MAG: hypothetical protein ACKOC9_10685, partial [Alphaproteobacteria bacterium]